MAGNFRQGSHALQWILDEEALLQARQQDLAILGEEEYQKIFIFFANFIQLLGEQLKLRQQVIATATVYFKRFYVRNSLKCVDPLLLAPVCVYVASKSEEFGVILVDRLVTACQSVVRNKLSHAFQEFPYRDFQILECEFYLLEHLNFSLIVYQPYRPLLQLVKYIGHDDKLQAVAWRAANDSLRTDASLLYSPFDIAISCLQIACEALHKDIEDEFSELGVDLENSSDVTRRIFLMKKMWRSFDEKKEIQSVLAKMPKPNTQRKR